MKTFTGKLAVITGGGSGMGRELAVQLSMAGCDVAMCDVFSDDMAKTQSLCAKSAKVTTHLCDVAHEDQVLAFKDAVVEQHKTAHINLLFNNAGIAGGGDFVTGNREHWERTFNVCWYGVYNNSRAFLPLLVASGEGYLVNVSSVNGFWACSGPGMPHTAYSAAKFAVKGFTESLITDLRLNAPHVKVALVMPGHIGTSIISSTQKVLGIALPEEMPAAELEETRQRLVSLGLPFADKSDDEVRTAIAEFAENFRDQAPTTAASAAAIILQGLRDEQWRILVGEDAHVLDRMVREAPEEAYDASFRKRRLAAGIKLF